MNFERKGIELGRTLLKYRLQTGLTQYEVADQSKVSRPYYGRLELGEIQVIYPKTFNALRRVLGFPGYEVLASMGYETDAGIEGIDPEVLSLMLKLGPEGQRHVIPFLRGAVQATDNASDGNVPRS